MKKKLFILGSTGSIGTTALSICEKKAEYFQIRGLSAHRNWKLLLEQVQKFQPEVVVITDHEAGKAFRQHYSGESRVLIGFESLLQWIEEAEYDILLNALVGARGLLPTVKALERGIPVALANKESLVTGGFYIQSLLKNHFSSLILPVDSEHSAIWQALQGEDYRNIRRIILTASGGPFRDKPLEALKQVTPEDALRHPNWSMGAKITIDSATMMNKALEIIEAYWLFGLKAEQIEVVIHRESIIHSMVEFVDGSVKAQMSYPTMAIPIQYALTYPDRMPMDMEWMDFTRTGSLHFQIPDPSRWPALRLAYMALTASHSHPIVMNAANEIAVQAFLERKITFPHILQVVEEMLNQHAGINNCSLEQILEIDRLTRERTEKFIHKEFINT